MLRVLQVVQAGRALGQRFLGRGEVARIVENIHQATDTLVQFLQSAQGGVGRLGVAVGVGVGVGTVVGVILAGTFDALAPQQA